MESSFRIKLTGLVQGVGFRPRVYQLSIENELKGFVNNNSEGLCIEFNARNSDEAQLISDIILSNLPTHSRVDTCKLEEIPFQKFDSFSIKQSNTSELTTAFVGPDIGICDTCIKEMTDVRNRRYNYPFISCQECGPRFSIQKSLPFERYLTSMDEFPLCEDCLREYTDPTDRRFHAQTMSCSKCGIKLSIKSLQHESIVCGLNQAYIERIRSLIFEESKLVAVKGVGGFILLADASKDELINKVRKIKRRSRKPLALMYPDLNSVAKYFTLNKNQKDILQSSARPILLLPLKGSSFKYNHHLIAPGLNHIGVMLPSSGLLYSILKGADSPVIATSANLSHEPISYVFDEQDSFLKKVDYVVDHDLDIAFAQDDSLVKVSTIHARPIMLRRSRGYAPMLMVDTFKHSIEDKLAFGADMKSSFCIQQNGTVYMSQTFGDLLHLDNYNRFLELINKFRSMVSNQAKTVLCDLHPDYSSTRIARGIATFEGLVCREIQHHKAHFAAVLAENDLLSKDKKVLGFIWDGMGYGEDGAIWGGECFVLENEHMKRICHLDYFTNLAGSKMSMEPRLSALSLFHGLNDSDILMRTMFGDFEWNTYRKLLDVETAVRSSSMGRLFDGIAAVLKLGSMNSYEGESAMKLEEKAGTYLLANPQPEPYEIVIEKSKIILKGMLQNIINDINNRVDASKIAARFHVTLVNIIKSIADLQSVNKLSFSGGVFQNSVLVDLIITNLSANYELYFHKELSPNDECISFGQIAYDNLYN